MGRSHEPLKIQMQNQKQLDQTQTELESMNPNCTDCPDELAETAACNLELAVFWPSNSAVIRFSKCFSISSTNEQARDSGVSSFILSKHSRIRWSSNWWNKLTMADLESPRFSLSSSPWNLIIKSWALALRWASSFPRSLLTSKACKCLSVV